MEKPRLDKSMNEQIKHCAIAWLEGIATDDELKILQLWVEESDENYAELKSLKQAWLQVGREQRYDEEKGWKSLLVRLSDQSFFRRRRVWIRWASCAAVLALLFAGGVLYWMNVSSSHETELLAEGNIEPGSRKAVLVLGSDEKVMLNDGLDDGILRNDRTVKKKGNTLVYESNGGNDTVVEFNRLITPRGGEYAVVLSDGTKVWLNAESELKYPVYFKGKERQVFLKGEAYFDVSRCEERPFTVYSDKARITVLGTEFNVKNYDDGAIATTLVEGAVSVSDGDNVCRLHPGQQAMISAQGLEVKNVETALYTAWKDGYFIYRETSLEDILKELSRWYDFIYFYQNERSASLNFTAKLKKFDSVEKVFEVLRATGEVDFVVKGKAVTVMTR